MFDFLIKSDWKKAFDSFKLVLFRHITVRERKTRSFKVLQSENSPEVIICKLSSLKRNISGLQTHSIESRNTELDLVLKDIFVKMPMWHEKFEASYVYNWLKLRFSPLLRKWSMLVIKNSHQNLTSWLMSSSSSNPYSVYGSQGNIGSPLGKWFFYTF